MQIITTALRAFQLIFSVVVLGISISLIRGQLVNNAPATTGYSAFTGGLGCLAALVGIVALFVDALNGIVTWAFDALAAVCFLAAGIAVSVGLRGTDCSNPRAFATFENDLISGGSIKINGKGQAFGYWGLDDLDAIQRRCRQNTAEAAFEFLGFIICAVVLAYTFFSSRKGGSASRGIV